MSDNTLIKLVNPKFNLEFAGKEYSVRKATLEKTVQYYQRIKELKDDPACDLKIIAYCIFLVLHDEVERPEITEEFVLNNTPGDIDLMETLTTLGFMNPKKMEIAQKIQGNVIKALTTDSSSPSSQKEQDGLPEKSETSQ